MDEAIHGLPSWILSALSCPHGFTLFSPHFLSTQGPLIESGPDSLTDHPPPALAVSSLEETGEIQYATLRFQQMKPRNPQEQEEVPENEYSEIKISKWEPQRHGPGLRNTAPGGKEKEKKKKQGLIPVELKTLWVMS